MNLLFRGIAENVRITIALKTIITSYSRRRLRAPVYTAPVYTGPSVHK